MNQLAPAIVAASEAFDPAVAFHAIENADEGGRFQMHPLGQFGLSERPFEREKTEHLGLPVRNAGWREFFVNRPLILVRRGHDPKPDAILEVVFKHGNGFRTNGKRPNDFLMLNLPLPGCKTRRTMRSGDESFAGCNDHMTTGANARRRSGDHGQEHLLSARHARLWF